MPTPSRSWSAEALSGVKRTGTILDKDGTTRLSAAFVLEVSGGGISRGDIRSASPVVVLGSRDPGRECRKGAQGYSTSTCRSTFTQLAGSPVIRISIRSIVLIQDPTARGIFGLVRMGRRARGRTAGRLVHDTPIYLGGRPRVKQDCDGSRPASRKRR